MASAAAPGSCRGGLRALQDRSFQARSCRGGSPASAPLGGLTRTRPAEPSLSAGGAGNTRRSRRAATPPKTSLLAVGAGGTRRSRRVAPPTQGPVPAAVPGRLRAAQKPKAPRRPVGRGERCFRCGAFGHYRAQCRVAAAKCRPPSAAERAATLADRSPPCVVQYVRGTTVCAPVGPMLSHWGGDSVGPLVREARSALMESQHVAFCWEVWLEYLKVSATLLANARHRLSACPFCPAEVWTPLLRAHVAEHLASSRQAFCSRCQADAGDLAKAEQAARLRLLARLKRDAPQPPAAAVPKVPRLRLDLVQSAKRRRSPGGEGPPSRSARRESGALRAAAPGEPRLCSGVGGAPPLGLAGLPVVPLPSNCPPPPCPPLLRRVRKAAQPLPAGSHAQMPGDVVSPAGGVRSHTEVWRPDLDAEFASRGFVPPCGLLAGNIAELELPGNCARRTMGVDSAGHTVAAAKCRPVGRAKGEEAGRPKVQRQGAQKRHQLLTARLRRHTSRGRGGDGNSTSDGDVKANPGPTDSSESEADEGEEHARVAAAPVGACPCSGEPEAAVPPGGGERVAVAAPPTGACTCRGRSSSGGRRTHATWSSWWPPA
jgi:hypothetical protein